MDGKYKNITVEIPEDIYFKMQYYCKTKYFPKRFYYCDFIKRAIEFYLDNHN